MENKLMDVLGRKGYKTTTERAVITDALQKVDTHFTAETLYRFLRDRGSRVSMATIYRTLGCLVHLRLLRKLDIGDGINRYELVERMGEKNTRRHHHLICVKCGKVIDFKSDLFPQMEQLMEKLSHDYVFKIFDHELTFFGYCKQCVGVNFCLE